MPNDPPPLPDKPTNLAVASRSSNSLAVTWNAAANADRYELEISWTGETRIFPALSPQKIEDLLSTASLPLFSNRIYNIRVRGVNSQGSSDWSDLLVTATLPPTPTPPSASGSMIEVDAKLSWNVDLAAQVDLTFSLFVEIARQESDGEIKTLPNATNLPLQGGYVDENPLTENSYFIRLYSDLPPPISRNISEWSSACFFRKQVFAKLQIPGIQESNALRNQLMRRYYGR
jgi:Fibronectin type III domain